MSDNIPFELQELIINKLPVEPLIRFRSVCKAWKSDSSDFILHHITQQKQQHLLVSSHGLLCSFGDRETDRKAAIWNHGLWCPFGEPVRKAVIWNPSIRKAIDVVMPDMADDEMYTTVLGFGVCRETTHPKIIKIRINSDMEGLIPWQVEVFTLSARVWRSTYSRGVSKNSHTLFELEKMCPSVMFCYYLKKKSN
ncbi:putative F-box domain-containing protein [Helianthus anomalus]